MSNYIHLHTHSEYSLVDGLLRLKSMVAQAKKMGMDSLALTDQSNLFGMIKFYQAAEKAGIKPILGSDVWVVDEQQPEKPFRLIVLCQNQQGFQHLMELVSRSYTEGLHQGVPRIQKTWLCEKQAGLIVIANAMESDVAQALLADNAEDAEALVKQWLHCFGDRFYLEITRLGRADEKKTLEQALSLARQTDCPLVATNAVRFLVLDDFEAHEARVCIHEGYALEDDRRPRRYTEQQYFRSPEEMHALFADIPEALQNAGEIAARCNVHLKLGQVFLPDYPIPNAQKPEAYLMTMAEQGLGDRCRALKLDGVPEKYQARLSFELNVINNMGFAGYFLIVADFIRWAKKHGIPVGPGRGSGAGSLVAYALDITDLDPLQYDLLFERFLNPERVSMPDFDIDFCMDGRDRVIDYVARTYGREAVSQIITYGTMAAKAVIRDVGRVLGLPYGFVDKIAKLIPMELGITLEKAMAQEAALKERYDQESDVQALLDMALKLEGITRNAGKHAGGVVIAPNRLTDFTPLYCDAEGALLTQLDKIDVELAGLVKFDFLGLRTLTIIDWALQSINRQKQAAGAPPIHIHDLPLNDAKTFQLLRQCQTTAVFQVESRGMKDLVRRLQPDTFEDIIPLVALFRPGPLQSGMVDDFINRKHGRAAIEYFHPSLEAILKPTYGIILYQEQVMQIAQVLSGYTLGGADLLRRAMGKKKPEEMAKQRSSFVAGAVKNGVEESLASFIFDVIEKFAGYGFNKSHSAAYALITYQTAWIKANYPADFMAAVLSSDMAHTDKVVVFIEEARSLGLVIEPPNIHLSEHRFVVNQENAIVYGLGAIKGVGDAAISALIEARNVQPFTDFLDVCRRVDTHKVSKRVLEALIKAGAFDTMNPNRAELLSSMDHAVRAAEQWNKAERQGQTDLFGALSSESGVSLNAATVVAAWGDQERLRAEKETLGLYLTGHPMNFYGPDIKPMITSDLKHLQSDRNRFQIVAGLLVGVRTVQTRRGDRMAIVTLEDHGARQEMILFSDLYQSVRESLEKDALFIAEVQVSDDQFSGGLRVRCNRIWGLKQAQLILMKRLIVTVLPDNAERVTDLLKKQPVLDESLPPPPQSSKQKTPATRSGYTVSLKYDCDGAQATVKLGKTFSPQDWGLVQKLKALCGPEAVNLEY